MRVDDVASFICQAVSSSTREGVPSPFRDKTTAGQQITECNGCSNGKESVSDRGVCASLRGGARSAGWEERGAD